MRRSLFNKWCDQAWLYVIYLIAVIMTGCLIWNWETWEISQKLVCALAIVVPCHVFEENTFPGGFYFMNNIGFRSKEPLVYPQNRCTNMITNLGAEIVIVLLTFFGVKSIEMSIITFVFLFGVAETINHTRSGIKMYSRYKKVGKKTIYGPGLITSWCLLIPLSVMSLKWLVVYPPTFLQVVGGFGILFGIIVCLILLPFAVSIRVKSRKYAFDSEGYFEKYEKKLVKVNV